MRQHWMLSGSLDSKKVILYNLYLVKYRIYFTGKSASCTKKDYCFLLSTPYYKNQWRQMAVEEQKIKQIRGWMAPGGAPGLQNQSLGWWGPWWVRFSHTPARV